MKTILAAIDALDRANEVLEQAIQLTRNCQAKLFLVHVSTQNWDIYSELGFPSEEMVPSTSYPFPEKDLLQGMVDRFHEDHKKLQERSAKLRQQGFDVTALMIRGEIPEKIWQEAQRLKADMVVIGHHQHGSLFKMVVGSTSEEIIKNALCPVLLVPMADES